MNSLLAGGDSKGRDFCRRFIPLRTESGGDGEQMAQVSKRFQGKKFLLLVVLCAVSIFLGTEFTSVKEKAQDMYDLITEDSSSISGVSASNVNGIRSFV